MLRKKGLKATVKARAATNAVVARTLKNNPDWQSWDKQNLAYLATVNSNAIENLKTMDEDFPVPGDEYNTDQPSLIGGLFKGAANLVIGAVGAVADALTPATDSGLDEVPGGNEASTPDDFDTAPGIPELLANAVGSVAGTITDAVAGDRSEIIQNKPEIDYDELDGAAAAEEFDTAAAVAPVSIADAVAAPVNAVVDAVVPPSPVVPIRVPRPTLTKPGSLGDIYEQQFNRKANAEFLQQLAVEQGGRSRAYQTAGPAKRLNPNVIQQLARAMTGAVSSVVDAVVPPTPAQTSATVTVASSTRAAKRASNIAQARAMQNEYYAGRPEARAADARRAAKKTTSVARYAGNVAKLDFQGTRNKL